MLYVFLFLSVLAAGFYTNAQTSYRSLSALWQFPAALAVCFFGLVLLFFLVTVVSCLFVNPKKILETPSGYFRFLLTQLCQILFFFAGVQVHVHGMERLPKCGRFMLVSNHRSALDPLVFYYAMPDAELAFLSKKDLFSRFLIAQMMRELLCLPVDRENDREALKSILKAIQFLKDDKASIGVFPEGTRNKADDSLLPFRPGAFKIAQKANVPIVVCCLKNSRMIHRNMFRKHTDVYLDILRILPADSLASKGTGGVSGQVRTIMEDGIKKQSGYEPEHKAII